MNELIPWIERLGAMGLLAGILWFVFGRLAPRLVEQGIKGLESNTESLRENTRVLAEITQESREAHKEIIEGLKDMTNSLERHESREEEVLRDISDGIKEIKSEKI